MSGFCTDITVKRNKFRPTKIYLSVMLEPLKSCRISVEFGVIIMFEPMAPLRYCYEIFFYIYHAKLAIGKYVLAGLSGENYPQN